MTLRELIERDGLAVVLRNLADVCETLAESDVCMVREWMRAANKIIKLSHEIDPNL